MKYLLPCLLAGLFTACTVGTGTVPAYGTYYGTFPCADCSGINYELTLSEDNTYRLRSNYLGKPDGRFEDSGTYTLSDGRIRLSGEELNELLVEEGSLVAMDRSGEPVTGDLAPMYLLSTTKPADFTMETTAPTENFSPDFTATGNEPGWLLDISWTEGVRLTTQEGDLDMTAPLTTGTRAADAEVIRYRTESDKGTLTFTLQPQPCTDDMSGKSFTHRVTVLVEPKAGGATENWSGCGSYPAGQPLSGNWVLRDFPGQEVPTGDRVPTISFDYGEGRVTGFSGCNRFSGSFSGEAADLDFGPVGGTKMACPGDNVEVPFLAILSADDLRADLLGNELTLRSGGERMVFVPAAQE